MDYLREERKWTEEHSLQMAYAAFLDLCNNYKIAGLLVKGDYYSINYSGTFF